MLAPVRALHAGTVVLVVGLHGACAQVQILESSPAACSNGVDDDEDGAVDCSDSACAASAVCEESARTCSDLVDNDGDGRADCQSQGCRDLGFCAAFETDCRLVPQAGCPLGMGCYAVAGLDDERTACALVDTGRAGDLCDPSIGDLGKGCGAGLLCVDGECLTICAGDATCDRSSICLTEGSLMDSPGTCSRTCLPSFGCSNGRNCFSMQRLGLPYDRFGFSLLCLTAADVPPGTATTGQPCDPRIVSSTPLERICQPLDLCMPDPAGDDRCRRICPAFDNPDSQANPCGEERCVPLDPYDTRPNSRTYTPGVCVP